MSENKGESSILLNICRFHAPIIRWFSSQGFILHTHMHILVTSWYEHSSIFQRVLFDSKGWCIGTPYHPFSTLWKIQVEISNSVSEILRFPGGLTQLLMINHVTKMSMVFLEKNKCYLIWPNQIIVFHPTLFPTDRRPPVTTALHKVQTDKRYSLTGNSQNICTTSDQWHTKLLYEVAISIWPFLRFLRYEW